MMLNIFSCVCWPSVYLLWKNVYSDALPIFNWVILLLLLSSLYTLDIKPLTDTWFANIFSHSVGCLFILMMVFFTVQKLFSLMWSHLISFAFISLAFEVRSTRTFAKTDANEVTAYVFFYEFYGFRSSIQVFNSFWDNFCAWCKIVV